MKHITIDDCKNLQVKFAQYCSRAGQHEFALLAAINIKMDISIDSYVAAGCVFDQRDANAMFRVVLKTIGEDYSEYKDNVFERKEGNSI